MQGLANGIAAFALVGCLIVFVLGAVAWAGSRRVGNYQVAETGKITTITAAAAALLIGGAPTIINFFLHMGQHLQ